MSNTIPPRAPAGSGSRPSPSPKKGNSGRMTGGLLGLSSAAIVSVFAAGYLNTQAADGQAPANTAANVVTQSTGGAAVVAPPVQTSASSSNSVQQPASAPSTTSNASNTSAKTSAYRDGTYVGTGSSRHGSLQATVVVSGGKIVSANVTACGTRYPCSKVNSLVSGVVSSQAAPVNYVSGATDSSTAYTQAVRSALSQAAS